jgi:CheY-like chemotaxis protein
VSKEEMRAMNIQVDLKKRKMESADLFRKRALIVEDNEALAYILAEYMEDSGVIVDFARNGQEALEKVLEAAYDFILMDIYMPVMNGFEATAKITSLLPSSTIIVITSSNERLEYARMKSAGAKDYLVKPVSKEKLIEAVGRNLQ